MHRTFELYLRHTDGRETFEPLTHRGTHIELLSHVRRVLAERGAETVEVREFGEHLITIGALPD